MVDEYTPIAVSEGGIDPNYTFGGQDPFNPQNTDNDDDSDILPLLHRSTTFSGYMKPAKEIALPISVNNPLNLKRRLSLVPGNDFDELLNRVDSLKTLRPFRLIGKIRKLIDWSDYEKSEDEISKMKNKKREFYEEQNEMIERYKDIDLLLDTGIQIEMIQNYADNTSTDTSNSDEEREIEHQHDVEQSNLSSSNTLTVPITAKKMKKTSTDGSMRIHNNLNSVTPGNIDLEGAKILGQADNGAAEIVLYAIYLNFALNVVLLLGKVVVVYMSDSLSLIASLVDSILDFFSTLIIFVANKFAIKKSSKFPVGRKQLEPIGVMIFSVVMILSFAQVLIESVKQLFAGDTGESVSLSMTAIIIMIVTITSKFMAYIICQNINNSSIQALVEDAKTDIIFNVFSLVFPTIGLFFKIWWIDALGASLLCLYVMIQWLRISFEHIGHLSGLHASKKDYQQVLYLIVRFTDEIAKIKNYRMYHIGDLVNVEVDIVLKNSKMSLKDCHDLGESLQYAIETLPYVNRCFVHLDYRVRNYVGHLS
jgi:cation diffusion facilitator family transporter